MKHLLTSSISIYLLFALLLFSCRNNDYSNERNDKNAFVDTLIEQMTIEEKVGQMTQLSVEYFFKKGQLKKDSLEKYISKYNIGSILNTLKPEVASAEEWQEFQSLIQDFAQKSRLKIPVLYGIDAIHGATYTENATLFPHNIGLAATGNPQLIRKAAEITAIEVLASGIRWNFDPVLDVGRNPIWPRFEETFGEDTYLVSLYGSEVVKAYEKAGLASCMKHFLGYSAPASGKDRSPAYIPDIQLFETFTPPFKAAVDAGASTIMINSGSINGVPVHANKKLLTGLLRDEWGFEGLIVTDWLDIINLHIDHKTAENNKEAIKQAINAGIDMSMVPLKMNFYFDLIDLIKNGEIDIKRIDDAVRRILILKQKLGLFKNPYPDPAALSQFNLPEYRQVAKQAALESITLLKNEDVLPLAPNMKIIVAGPTANSLSSLHGSWSYTWTGQKEALFPSSTNTVQEQLRETFGVENVMAISEASFHTIEKIEIEKLKQNSPNCDVIILCLGEDSYAEGTGNIDDLRLPEDQINLAGAAAATGKPVVAVLLEGRPRIINDIEPLLDGVIMGYRPGSQGAQAIVDVLNGAFNPSGKLPFSYPRHTGNIIPYDAPARTQKYYNPQWPLGHGLSYTTFEYGEIEVTSDTISSDSEIVVSVEVTNTGQKDGEVITNLFVKDLYAGVIPPMQKLRAFQKVMLKAGESANVNFTLSPDDFSYINSDLNKTYERGMFEIIIENQKRFIYGDF